jgi:hypothetical protein
MLTSYQILLARFAGSNPVRSSRRGFFYSSENICINFHACMSYRSRVISRNSKTIDIYQDGDRNITRICLLLWNSSWNLKGTSVLNVMSERITVAEL